MERTGRCRTQGSTPGRAQLLINIRAYEEPTRKRIRAAIERIVTAECEASGSPRPPEFEYYDSFPLTDNSQEAYDVVSAAFADYFGDKSIVSARSTGSEDFSDIPRALGVPYLFWFWGGFDPTVYHEAAASGTLGTAIPGNHASTFVPVLEPTMRTGISAMTVALLSYLG